LDTAFGNGGTIQTDFLSAETGYAVAIQSGDDKIIVCGGNDGNMLAARYGVDGALDSTFAVGGRYIRPMPETSSEDRCSDVGVDGLGRIVLGGYYKQGTSDWRALVVRLDPSGVDDTTFATNGVANIQQDRRWRAIAIQSDNKVLLTGTDHQGTVFKVFRFDDVGALDSGFDADGLAIVDPAAAYDNDRPHAVALSNSGDVIIAGQSFVNGEDFAFSLVRFTSAGAFDPTFGVAGFAQYSFVNGGVDDIANAMVIQPDDKIIAAGSTEGTFLEIGVMRLNADGSLDSSFGSGGKQSIASATGSLDGYGVALQGDGKIVVAGSHVVGAGTPDVALVRFNADGSMDTSFGPNGTGLVIQDLGGSEWFNDVAIDSSGKIVAAGEKDGDFLLQRYHP